MVRGTGTRWRSELEQLIATELTERPDRDHPLWEVIVIDQLSANRWALMLKAHHTMVDGISEITLLESFSDQAAEERKISRKRLSRTPLLGRTERAVRAPISFSRHAIGTVRTLAPVLYAVIAPSSSSSLNGPIGRQRRYVVARTALPQVREIAKTFDFTVNDVAVAAIAAACRRLLLRRGEHPTSAELRIRSAISTRSTAAKRVLDNRVSAMIAHLPVEVDDPVVERLMGISTEIAVLFAHARAGRRRQH
ncbi:wax ester/triacylglycerol synthase domain-containing protein [Nocardia testacea]|uniref:wax ester/triacylglycerol synthase domain-containing protein n=1 Tax=Nocardia testacea TaxID=248551 RepID=UPI003A887999